MSAPTMSSEAEARIALGHARRHLQVHADWVQWLKEGKELPHEKIGDLAHHEAAVQNYNLICKVLRRASGEEKT